jgi:hypothetical protein
MRSVLILIVFFSAHTYGQPLTSFDIKLISTYDHKELAFSPLEIHQDGNLIKSTYTDVEGNCRFSLSNSGVIIITADGINFKPKDTLILLNNKINQFTLMLDSTNEEPDYSKIYNEEIAFQDLRKGEVKVLFVGLLFVDEINKINQCCKKFGFKYTFTHDVITGTLKESVKNYNRIIFQYLELRNGPGWKDKLNAECNLYF